MDPPIFVIGCPRSGTTLLQELLCTQGKLAWVSSLVDHFPRLPALSLLNRVNDLPRMGHWISTRCNLLRRAVRPTEPWNFFNSYMKYFQWPRHGDVPPRRRISSDISRGEIEATRRAFQRICSWHGKRRLLTKYTDFPRIQYLRQIFPDAVFLRTLRDPRAVVYSYCQKIESGDFHNWDEREWWCSGWPESWAEDWRKNHCTSLGLAAYQYKFLVREIECDVQDVNGKGICDVAYEAVVADTKRTLRQVLEFCAEEYTERLDRHLSRIRLTNENHKWRTSLSPSQIEEVEYILSA